MNEIKMGQQEKIGSGLGQTTPRAARAARLPKEHENYWKSRLRRRAYRNAKGALVEVPEWQVKLYHQGRHLWINLETANKEAAAKKARDQWRVLKTIGWDAVKPKRERLVDPTVGDFLGAVRAEADLRPATFEIYARKFRRLVSGVVGIADSKAKHDHHGDGSAQWRERVHGVRLSRITPEAVQRWKTRYIAAAGTNPLRDRRARRTIASVLRSSKALFASDIVRKLHMELPDPLPLAGVDVPRASAAQYVSKIEPGVLFQQAQRELEAPTDEYLWRPSDAVPKEWHGARGRWRRENDDAIERRRLKTVEARRRQGLEMFKILCLALFAGLRRDEIDTLTWSQIDFVNHLIRVETTEHTHAKSEGSEAAVDVDPELTRMLKGWMSSSDSAFVVASRVDPRPSISTYHHYRCDRLFKALSAWLREKGVEDRNALHTLRKEFGTQINRTHGLFAASAALRHSSIQLTRAVYVAKKDRAVFSLPVAAIDGVQQSERAAQ